MSVCTKQLCTTEERWGISFEFTLHVTHTNNIHLLYPLHDCLLTTISRTCTAAAMVPTICNKKLCTKEDHTWRVRFIFWMYIVLHILIINVIYTYFTPCMAVSVTLTTILCSCTAIVPTICNKRLCTKEDHTWRVRYIFWIYIVLHILVIYTYFTPFMAFSVILKTCTAMVTTICNKELCVQQKIMLKGWGVSFEFTQCYTH